jgi:F-type H+-transporting ATPase subunit delta
MAGRPSTAARRYAEAAFELARRDGTEDAWRYALRAASEALGSADILRIVENPARPHSERIAVVRAALSGDSLAALVRAVIERDASVGGTPGSLVDVVRSRVADQLVNLVALLLDRRGVSLLPAIAGEYDRILDRERGIVRALVTSAAPLTDDEAAALRDRVEGMTASQVDLSREVDPALIGGLTVRVGDRLVDASVRGRLERLRHQLLAGGSRQPTPTGS